MKDCFFNISLQIKDRNKFAFTIPVYNHGQCTGNLTIWMGNFTLNINDPKGPFQVHLHINKSYSAIACVKFPYSLLYGQWIWNEILGVISCSDCNLTQCINRSWWENVENK